MHCYRLENRWCRRALVQDTGISRPIPAEPAWTAIYVCRLFVFDAAGGNGIFAWASQRRQLRRGPSCTTSAGIGKPILATKLHRRVDLLTEPLGSLRWVAGHVRKLIHSQVECKDIDWREPIKIVSTSWIKWLDGSHWDHGCRD